MSVRSIAAAQKCLQYKMALTRPTKSQTTSLNTFTTCMKDALNDCASHQITPAAEQTKTWRKEQPWYKTGKSNECELYQRQLVEQITQGRCIKTCARIKLDTYEIRDNASPMSYQDGFEWTEDFDGKQTIHNITIYYNLKMVCDSGGAQTRTLREVYHFVHCQLEHLLQTQNKQACNIYFVNILDGDQSCKRQKHFEYLLAKDKYSEVKKYVFCGDMHTFGSWYDTVYPSLVSKYPTSE